MTVPVSATASFEELSKQFESEARLDEVFIVLSVGAGLIATLGLLSNSPAVVIGAMLVAPWILPLRAASFAILHGLIPLALRALFTLTIGVGITVLLSWLLGVSSGIPVFGSEVTSRTTPNLLDLGIALVAGALATYAKVRNRAVSSLAGTAIAVALVPPVCVLGLLLSIRRWEEAQGAGLLFAANLLGILSGALITFAATEKGLWKQLWRSRLGAISLLLTALLLIPLTGSFLNLVAVARRESYLQQIETAIAESLRSETITLGRNSELLDVHIDWSKNPPLIQASVRVTSPNLPTSRQVAAVQKFINSRQPIRYRLVVQRASIDVVGPEAEPNPVEIQEKLQGASAPPPPPQDVDPSKDPPLPPSEPTSSEAPPPSVAPGTSSEAPASTQGNPTQTPY
jgi:uncharacterized hydrophobic protein (TIGR00271 family)